MGRKAKPTKLSELNQRILRCKCGEPVEVNDDNVVSVICCYCATNSTPVRTPEQFAELEKMEREKKNEVENAPKKRGRPRLSDEEKKRRVEEKASKKVKKKSKKVVSKKGKSMNTEKKSVGKRGRKPSVGSVVLNLIKENGQANINDLYEVYSNKLNELGIAENTLVIAMADNGPMTHNPPPGLGMAETIYRGGKGDFLEGGVRVPAFAWWPGVIEPGQVVGDIIHETDLFTTFASLAGATQYIPTDRVIDGIDQSALLMYGDTHGRRDHVFIYAGPTLGATVKGNYKRHWISPDPVGEASGIPAAFYFLPSDPREKTPMLVNLIHLKSPFNRMRLRHELWKKKYPDAKEVHGIAWTGIENATPEVQALAKPRLDLEKLPFDPLEYVEHLDQLPFDPNMNPDLGQ